MAIDVSQHGLIGDWQSETVSTYSHFPGLEGQSTRNANRGWQEENRWQMKSPAFSITALTHLERCKGDKHAKSGIGESSDEE